MRVSVCFLWSSLECVNPKRFANAIDRLVNLPCGIQVTHPSYIMRTDDVCSWSRCVDQQPINNFGITNIAGQAIIFGARTLEGIEEHNGHIFEPALPYILRSLFHTLAPVDIGIVQKRRSSCRAA